MTSLDWEFQQKNEEINIRGYDIDRSEVIADCWFAKKDYFVKLIHFLLEDKINNA